MSFWRDGHIIITPCTCWDCFCHTTVMSRERHGVSYHRQLSCLFHSWFRLTSQKISKHCITDFLWWESTGGFPSHMTSNAETVSRPVIVPTFRLLANHSVTYFRCGPALWRQPWKSHKQTPVDEAWTTRGRAVGLPKQHSFCIFSRMWSVAIHWHTQWSWLVTW